MDPWKSVNNLSTTDIRKLQGKKLSSFITNYVYPFSPYYKRLFDEHKIDPRSIRTPEDLARVEKILA